MSMLNMLEIDGSILEGGGQILRISISLSAILGVPIRVSNIRAGRSKPGLAAQHLKGIELVARMCQAKLKGAHLGSTQIEFTPGTIRGGQYMSDIFTAGSISLLIQVALPCALLADGPVSLELRGGTNVENAPQIEYINEVFRPMLRKFGGDFRSDVHKKGFFPKGGGFVTVEVSPVRNFTAADLTERGTVENVHGFSYVSGVMPIKKFAHPMANAAREQLRYTCTNINIECYQEERRVAPENGWGLILISDLSTGCVVGSDGIGKRGAEPYGVGMKAGEQLRKILQSGACVDSHTQDQLIIYMALAEGKSSIRVADVTLHTKTAIHVAELISKVKFDIQQYGNQNVIECVGLGIINKNLPPE